MLGMIRDPGQQNGKTKACFFRLHNPLPFLLGQPAVMVPGQDRRQPAGHPPWSAAGLSWDGRIRQ